MREALGASDIPVEIENVQRWNACAEWAAQLQDGRVFIVGDAAHNMPPTGGFGGNTGVQDGHNLAWKLALVLSGVAGDGLLATYDAERRAVAEMTVEQAYTRYVLRLAPELGKENLQAIVPEATVELGYRYSSSAVVVEDDGDGAMVENALVENALVENPAEPSARPGTRAPHLVVASDSEPISLLDVMGHGFVLFAGGEGASWCDAAPAVAATLGLTLDAYAVGSRGALVDEQGLFEELYGVGPAGASLIRPDGFVAWRTRSAGDDAEAVMHAVLSRILAR